LALDSKSAEVLGRVASVQDALKSTGTRRALVAVLVLPAVLYSAA
jgi:hypothetical protein